MACWPTFTKGSTRSTGCGHNLSYSRMYPVTFWGPQRILGTVVIQIIWSGLTKARSKWNNLIFDSPTSAIVRTLRRQSAHSPNLRHLFSFSNILLTLVYRPSSLLSGSVLSSSSRCRWEAGKTVTLKGDWINYFLWYTGIQLSERYCERVNEC